MVVHEYITVGSFTDWCAVVAHGAAQLPYCQKHPLVKDLQQFVSSIYSILLPLHGPNSSKPLENPVQDALDQIYNELAPLIRGKKVIFIAYSLGALLLMKQWERVRTLCKCYIGVFVGSGLTTTEEKQSKCKQLWDPSFITKQNRDHFYKELHGSTWRNTFMFLQFTACSDEQELYCSPKERDILLQDRNVYFFNGGNDQLFPIETVQTFTTSESKCKIFVVEKLGHFDYFTRGWVSTRPLVQQVIQTSVTKSKL
jgi:hypothetical protein